MTATSLSPNDAASNVGAWLGIVGIADAPVWLDTKAADNWGFILGTILTVSSVSVTLVRRGIPSRKTDEDGAKFQSADLPRWDKVNEFTPVQVAWLWNDLEPQGERMDGTPAQSTYRRLQEGLGQNGWDKAFARVNGEEFGLKESYSRQQLIDNAVECGERPKFLFPEKRKGALTQAFRRLNSREICFADHSQYGDLNNFFMALYEMEIEGTMPADGTDKNVIVQNEITSGRYEVIGRRVIGRLKYAYERIPPKALKGATLRFDELNAGGSLFTNIRVKKIGA